MQTPVSSPQNQYVKLYRSLEKRKAREETGFLPLEGLRLVSDSIAAGAIVEAVLLRDDLDAAELEFLKDLGSDVAVVAVEPRLFDKTAFTENPQGVLAIARKPHPTLNELFNSPTVPLLLVVDGVQDPGNLGTMIRSAAAAGAAGVVVLPGSVDAGNPKAIRAAMGAHFMLPVVECTPVELIARLNSRNIQLVVTQADAALPYYQHNWTGPVAIAVGNEGSGISDQIAAAAEVAVTIPMARPVESLNAAIATSVILFEAARLRQ